MAGAVLIKQGSRSLWTIWLRQSSDLRMLMKSYEYYNAFFHGKTVQTITNYLGIGS